MKTITIIVDDDCKRVAEVRAPDMDLVEVVRVCRITGEKLTIEAMQSCEPFGCEHCDALHDDPLTDFCSATCRACHPTGDQGDCAKLCVTRRTA